MRTKSFIPNNPKCFGNPIPCCCYCSRWTLANFPSLNLPPSLDSPLPCLGLCCLPSCGLPLNHSFLRSCSTFRCRRLCLRSGCCWCRCPRSRSYWLWLDFPFDTFRLDFGLDPRNRRFPVNRNWWSFLDSYFWFLSFFWLRFYSNASTSFQFYLHSPIKLRDSGIGIAGKGISDIWLYQRWKWLISQNPPTLFRGCK